MRVRERARETEKQIGMNKSTAIFNVVVDSLKYIMLRLSGKLVSPNNSICSAIVQCVETRLRTVSLFFVR